MNWILLSPPPLSSDPDTPSKFGTCTSTVVAAEVMCRDKQENAHSEMRIKDVVMQTESRSVMKDDIG